MATLWSVHGFKANVAGVSLPPHPASGARHPDSAAAGIRPVTRDAALTEKLRPMVYELGFLPA